MCYGCYEKYGKPKPDQDAMKVANMLKSLDEFGPCHIVISDWNLSKPNIDFCIREAKHRKSYDDIEAMHELRKLTLKQRAAALGEARGYVD